MAIHKLDALALDAVLAKVGFSRTGIVTSPTGGYTMLRTAWAKAMAESGGYYDIVSPENPDGSRDWGLFQINDKAHKAGLGADWARILEPEFNASLAYKWTGAGKEWGTWGLGLNGWAGSLHDKNPAAWSMIQKSFQKWYDAYPEAIKQAEIVNALPTVVLAKLVPGTRDPEIKKYQEALREFLADRKIDINKLNPSGATGFYGSETKAMTERVYRYQASVTGNLSWLRGDITTPGPKMLEAIGLRAI
jgi:hypothetical protein